MPGQNFTLAIDIAHDHCDSFDAETMVWMNDDIKLLKWNVIVEAYKLVHHGSNNITISKNGIGCTKHGNHTEESIRVPVTRMVPTDNKDNLCKLEEKSKWN